ncbi:MAG: hypothetical protein K6B67_03240 [Lachnospiraceae bacterium]|nr:hypothetical protein [Lachnospiraceae bacterium]
MGVKMVNKDLIELENNCNDSIHFQKSSLDALASCFNDKAWTSILNEKDTNV